jgi:filamentous hemagglutinin
MERQGQALAQFNTQDSRVQALGAAATALNAYNTANQIMEIAKNPAAAASIGINLSIGGSKTQSNTESSNNTATGSTVAAGGDIRISAMGAGVDSNLTVQGSRITAGDNIRLYADCRFPSQLKPFSG